MSTLVGNVSSLLGHSPEDYDLVDAANSDEETVELEVDWRDQCGRLLACTVIWNGATCEAEAVTAWDENGNKVELDFDVREAIVRSALS